MGGGENDLRSAERAFWERGERLGLERALALVEGELHNRPYAAVFRRWLLLLRYDRFGDDRDLDEALRGATGWMSVAAALRRAARDGDRADLDRAIALGCPPRAPEGGNGFLWEIEEWGALDLSKAYLERYRLGGSEHDLLESARISREALRAAEEPLVRAACLALLGACEHEFYLLRDELPSLERAIRGYERALEMVGTEAVSRPMMLTELGTALQDRFARDEDPEDIARAVALAEEAVRIDTRGPDMACHLVNLGTALNTRYEHVGEPEDLDRALRCWHEAFEALPSGSPYRPAVLERRALGHLNRALSDERKEDDLDAAVELSRAALREGAGLNDELVYANNLAGALEERWNVRRDPADLDEAISVLDAAAGDQSARAPLLVANLAQILLTRFQAFGTLADIDAAIDALRRFDRRRLGPSDRAAIAESLARALSSRYQVLGRPEDLGDAIAAARRGLTRVNPYSLPWSSRATRLAALIHLRYQRDGRRRDLDQAIHLMRQVTEISVEQGRSTSGDQLVHLAGFLMDRYERDGDPADREAAIRLAGTAEENDHREQAPHLTANLASALHERFEADGSLDELDFVISRHRVAVQDEVPSAPAYPTLLNNLGVALQDKYLYQDDRAALDEAIGVHQRALTACSAFSPERPGLLNTLAAAVVLRFDRDSLLADLDWATDLYERALKALAPHAPERASFLGNLAEALHMRARHTSEKADFDRSVTTFRSALRRTRPSQPSRAELSRGYAEVLAERHERFSTDGRAKVLRAFRKAVAASENAPVPRLHAASELGVWALQQQLWSEAGDAFGLADRARRTLFAAQRARVHGDTWLKKGEDLNANEAYARIRTGALPEAAIALDRGRALRLSAALDARIIATRLRADGLHDLANRYEQASQRVGRQARA